MNYRLLGVMLTGTALLGLRALSQSSLVSPKSNNSAAPATKSHQNEPAPMTDFEKTGQTPDGFGWTQQSWTGNDAPYRVIRAAIDRSLARGTNPQKLIASYRAKEEYDSQNPLAVFGWAYARYQSTQAKQITFNLSLWDVPGELAEVPSPQTYNFIRLRFLTEAQGRDTSPLRSVGERLLQQDQTDQEVSLALVRVLRPLRTSASNAEAKKIMDTLISRSPQVPLYYQLLANVYSDTYMSEGFKPRNAQLAVASFQDFLRLAPANDPQRPGCEDAILWLRKAQTLDWTPARTRPKQPEAPSKVLVPPRLIPSQPAFKYPTGPGQPLPPVPLSNP